MIAPSANPAASTSNINGHGADLNKEGAQTSSLGLVSASATSGDKGKHKRSEKGSSKPRKQQTKEKKHHNVFDEELDTEDYDEAEDEEDTESSSEEELTNNDEEELPNTRSRKGTQGTTMDPSCFIETGVKSPANGNVDTALSVQLPEPAAVDGEPVVQLSGPTSLAGAAPLTTGLPPLAIESTSIAGAAPLTTCPTPLAIESTSVAEATPLTTCLTPLTVELTSISGAAPLTTGLSPSTDESTSVAGAAPFTADPLTIEGLEPPVAVALPPVDVQWPPWFGQAYTQLTSANFGPAFSAAILKYVELEECTNFGVGVARAGFKNDKRPDEVAWWIARGHKVTPKIPLQKLPAFEKAWWAWWKGLQPIVCGATQVEGFLNATHHGHLHGEDGWACLHRHGQNGWYTVLTTVVWWATTLGEDRSSHARWVAAVEDVNWVLSQVLSSLDSSLSRYVLLVLIHLDTI